MPRFTSIILLALMACFVASQEVGNGGNGLAIRRTMGEPRNNKQSSRSVLKLVLCHGKRQRSSHKLLNHSLLLYFPRSDAGLRSRSWWARTLFWLWIRRFRQESPKRWHYLQGWLQDCQGFHGYQECEGIKGWACFQRQRCERVRSQRKCIRRICPRIRWCRRQWFHGLGRH